MTMVLKSGTSQFHASAWEFNRNDYFDAQNYFVPNTELRLNVYGFNVGGPVTLGHFYNPDKKRTFFFYNMEWRPLVTGGATNQTVPGTDTYGGNFSSLGSTIIGPDDRTSCPWGSFCQLPRWRCSGGNRSGYSLPRQRYS